MQLPSVGDVLGGKYVLVGMLGRGGMGIVFEGKQTDLQRGVAVKVFTDEAEGPNAARFQREIHILAKVAHPHIVTILDFFAGDRSTPPYVVMELLRGRTLSELVKAHGRLEPARAARIGQQLLEALDAAHANGIVHRDVKPANVFCVEGLQGDFVKLLDFGVAKDLGESRALTAPGNVVGTVSYMAPEQLLGQRAGFLSDVYATGATLYYLLAGKKPFDFESVGETARAVIENEPASLLAMRPDATELARVIHTAMAKSPGARYPTAKEMHEALFWALSQTPPSPVSAPVPTSLPTRQLAQAPSSGAAPALGAPPNRGEPTLASVPALAMIAPAPPPAAPLAPAPRSTSSGMRWGIAVAGGIAFLVIVIACLATALVVVVLETKSAPALAVPLIDAGALPVAVNAPPAAPSASGSAPVPSAARPRTRIGAPIAALSSSGHAGPLCFCDLAESGALCKTLDAIVVCRCIKQAGVRGCKVPLTSSPRGTDPCIDETIKGTGLRGGQLCNAFFAPGAASEPGTLECDYCATQPTRVYVGKTGDSCTGFEVWGGGSHVGRLDCE